VNGWGKGHGTGGEERKRRRNGERRSGVFFLEGSVPALPKISAHQEIRPSEKFVHPPEVGGYEIKSRLKPAK